MLRRVLQVFVGGPWGGHVERTADAPLVLETFAVPPGPADWHESLEPWEAPPPLARYVRVASPRGSRAVYAFDGELDEHERALVLEELREDAIAACRRVGCDCSPRFVLVPHAVMGGWEAWASEHDDRCTAARGFSARR